jgi:hypothetical protein
MAKKNSTPAPAPDPGSRVAHILDLRDAGEFLDNAQNITATEARLVLANVCGRTSDAAARMRNLDAAFNAAASRSAEKAAIRMDRANLKADMDSIRARCRSIIDAAAVEYQNRALVAKGENIERSRDSKRKRFLDLRAWLAENDPEWFADA